jgi:CHASE2 domain-containing sensor protein
LLKKDDIFKQNWKNVAFLLCFATIVVFVVQILGLLQPFEWKVYDWFFQIRANEPKDRRIVIVGMTESDIRKYGHPISDRDLARLIEKIKAQKPDQIGLDLVRDLRVGRGKNDLDRVFKMTPNLIGIEKVIGSNDEKIAPSPILKKYDRVAIADVEVDKDGVLRRGIYHVKQNQTDYISLGGALAYFYLQKRDYRPDSTSSKAIKWGNVVFPPFRENDGGYRRNYLNSIISQNNRDNNRSFYLTQYLINFRNPAQSFERVSFSQVLDDCKRSHPTEKKLICTSPIKPNFFKNKIVLIGMTAISIKDEFYTPYSFSFNTSPKPVHGVEFQANLTSHIISAVLEGRPIVKSIPEWGEFGLVLLFGIITTILIWLQASTKNYSWLTIKIIGITLFLASSLMIASFSSFSLGGMWIPIIFPLIEIIIISIANSGLILHWKNLELKALQEELIFEKKRAALASLLGGVTHDLKNSLNAIILFVDLIRYTALKIREKLVEEINLDRRELLAEIEIELDNIKKHSQTILHYGDKSKKIIERFLYQFKGETSKSEAIDVNHEINSLFEIALEGKQIENDQFCINIETNYDLEIGEREVVLGDFCLIITNLVYNACDELIKVFDEKQQKEEAFSPILKVSTQLLAKDWLEIVVSDNGEGIDESISSEIFKSFKTTKPVGKGTGMGLYFVYELVKKNQGQINWYRKDGFTNFVVKLPMSEKISK